MKIFWEAVFVISLFGAAGGGFILGQSKAVYQVFNCESPHKQIMRIRGAELAAHADGLARGRAECKQ